MGGCTQLQHLALRQTAWGGAFDARGLHRLRGCRQLALALGDCPALQVRSLTMWKLGHLQPVNDT